MVFAPVRCPRRLLVGGGRARPTAALSVSAGLTWWEVHLGPLGISGPMLRDCRYAALGHTPRAAVVIQPWQFLNLVALARRTPDHMGMLARLLALITLLCVRWEHLRRTETPEWGSLLVSAHAQRGKRRAADTRPGFTWSVSTFCPYNFDLLGPLRPLMDDVASSTDSFILIPDLQHDRRTKEWAWVRQHMSYAKLVAFVRRSFQDDALTFNSLRRFLPFLAHAFSLDDADAQAVGNWQEIDHKADGRSSRNKASFPMARRYAEGTASYSGRVRAALIAGLYKALQLLRKHLGSASLLDGRLLAPGSLTFEHVRDLRCEVGDLDLLPIEPPPPPPRRCTSP